MTQSSYDIFLPGDYFFDLIYTGLPEFPTLGREIFSEGLATTGGALFITAVALHRLGVKVAWSSSFGTDSYSQFVRQLAVDEGLDMSHARDLDRPFRRISTALPYQGERAFISYVDPLPADQDDYWLAQMQACDFRHLHLGAVWSPERLDRMAQVARARGATISMDCQDMPDLYSICSWKDLLAKIDLFMPNAREAMQITGSTAVQGAIETLMEWAKAVVVKDGANGAWLGYEGAVHHIPAIDAGPVLDTTGAGDSFNAGFLYGWIVEGAPFEVCARYGNICGGISVTAVGGATAAPTLDTLKEWYARIEA
jgi:sugar/nucleoside kinase (ribokinase family)